VKTLNAIEAGLEPDELAEFNRRVLERYSVSDFADRTATPEAARVALRFCVVMAEEGFSDVKFVPSRHVLDDGDFDVTRGGELMLIFDGGGHIADDVQFSARWHEIERALGAWCESYNGWSLTVRGSRTEYIAQEGGDE
jgi:hypothetical protein